MCDARGAERSRKAHARYDYVVVFSWCANVKFVFSSYVKNIPSGKVDEVSCWLKLFQNEMLAKMLQRDEIRDLRELHNE